LLDFGEEYEPADFDYLCGLAPIAAGEFERLFDKITLKAFGGLFD